MNSAVNLRILPSPMLITFIIISHGFAFFLVWFCGINLAFCIVIDFCVLVSGWRALTDHWLVGERLLLLKSSGWELWRKGADQQEIAQQVFLNQPALLWSWLVVLVFSESEKPGLFSKRKITLVLLRDNTDVDELRRLRVILRTT